MGSPSDRGPGSPSLDTADASALTPSDTSPPSSHHRSSIPGRDHSPLSPLATDRVFPIRSVINIEPPISQDAQPVSPAQSSSPPAGDAVIKATSIGTSGRSSAQSGPNQTASRPASNVSGRMMGSPASLASPGTDRPTIPPIGTTGFYAARHKHIQSDEGHLIITGVSGSERIQRCEDEPIRIPGAVQSFGCLIAFRESEDGSALDIRIVSENSEDIIGYAPRELFECGDFCSILPEEQSENLFDHIDFIREDTDARMDGPEVFSLTVTDPYSNPIKLWCAIHIPEGNPDLFICEFELEDDHKFPLAHVGDDPPSPQDTLQSIPTPSELIESTVSTSKPLRVLRHARKRKGAAAAMEVFNLMSQIQEQLSSASTLENFLKVLVGLVKELTGFHRVMMYQFDEEWNGKVVTELVDPRATKDLYKGLHFPASDIPAQARELYKLNKVRLLYDRDSVTARLVCRTQKDLEKPLDLTHSYLRAMSPIHLKYLANMAVRASMSISVTAFGDLWGLVSCHSYGPKPMRVSFPIRKMCRLIGETASRNVERLNYARRLYARKLINTIPTDSNPGGYIVASSEDLLKLFDADCGLLSIRDETQVLGKLENSQECLVMLEYLRARRFTTVVTSHDLAKNFPDLKYEPGFQQVAGLLLVPLSPEGYDFIVFFRKPQLKSVHWAGNPYEKTLKEGTDAFLEPRKSFKIWSETVKGKSREWTEEQIETAAVLCLVYGKFIEVWRQKEAALKNSQLTRLLLANASHEVRTPLNAIINYLEIALEGPLDKETRDNLARSHSASKSLIYVINDLLDLTRTEGGQDLVQAEKFDLHQTLLDATDMFKADCERKNISFEIIEHPGLPASVKGDPNRLRQVVANITANAVKHTSEGGIKIELWAGYLLEDGRCGIEIAVQDTGAGMSPQTLDVLFREFEQVQPEDEVQDTQNTDLGASVTDSSLSNSPGKKILGLGLAIVARTIRNMNGQLRLKSEEGKGSRFTVSLPLTIVSDREKELSASPLRSPAILDSPSLEPKGELTLVQPAKRASSRPSIERMRRDSTSSFKSTKSHKSELERLVDAFTYSQSTDSPPVVDGASGGAVATSPRRARPTLLSRSSSTSAVPAPTSPLENFRQGKSKAPRTGDPVVPSGAATPGPPKPTQKSPNIEPSTGREGFVILVAEDDPINSKIIRKRLERMGHKVLLTVNGKECFEAFQEGSGKRYDAVLMDMQMPIMDGGTSATCIREYEREYETERRTPILAVSASLIESQKDEYCRLGFDGWILKPIDFGRLAFLLEGTRVPENRKEAVYRSGRWERGGWFSAS